MGTPTVGTPERGVRAVLLDMDDTIFDHALTCRAAIASLRSARSFLRRRRLDDLWREYSRLLDEFATFPGEARPSVEAARNERWRRVALGCGESLSAAEVAELSGDYRRRYQGLRRAVPGSLALLERLHGRVKLVVVTNNEVAEQEEKVRFLGVEHLLDGLVVSEGVGVSKPDRRIFEQALGIAGVAAHQATMVGDSWASDVLGARGAGVRPVWFNRFGLPRPAGMAVDELRSFRPLRPAQELLLRPAAPAGAGPTLPGPSAL